MQSARRGYTVFTGLASLKLFLYLSNPKDVKDYLGAASALKLQPGGFGDFL